jgi:transcriptional regulator with XRE-family HTH domain
MKLPKGKPMAHKTPVPHRAAKAVADKHARGEQLGDRLRDVRKTRGLTLAEVSRRTGLAVSTLSKVENNKIALTYHNLARLAQGLELDLAEFFTPHTIGSVSGRWSVTRRGGGRMHESQNYAHEYLCVDLVGRRMVPMLSRVKAHSIEEFGELISHPGEEFFFVVEGTVDVYTEGNPPVRLRAGDSFYFDARMGHAVICVGAGDAYTMTVISPPVRSDQDERAHVGAEI